MTLTNLPPISNITTMAHAEKLSSIHLSLSSILSNLFLMKMDWLTSRGLPCGDYRQLMRITRLHTRLVTSWQSLTCLFLRSIPVEDMTSMDTELQANLVRVMNTSTNRYPICQMRKMRDCVLLEQAEKVLISLESL